MFIVYWKLRMDIFMLELEVEGAEEKEPPASREVQGSNAF